MKNEVLGIKILEQVLKGSVNIHYTIKDIQNAIKQIKDLEHYSHYTSGLWCTDRPDLLSDNFKKDYAWQIDFWKEDNL